MSHFRGARRAWLPPIAWALLSCSSSAPGPEPVPCGEACQDRVAVRAVREMTKLAYNLLLQGNPVGPQSELAPCPLGGLIAIDGTATSNASQGATEVDLVYQFDGCHHLEVGGDPEETYEMTLTGGLSQRGTLAVQPSATTALLLSSDAMTMDGTVHDPPIEYHAPDCPLSLAQDGNRLSGLVCDREVGLDLGEQSN